MPVILTIGFPDGSTQSYQQTIFVKDYLIVSIGDSYASGQGNPDIVGFWDWHIDPFHPIPTYTPPVWEDSLCNRSSVAGPVQAAVAIEPESRPIRNRAA